MKHSVCIVGGCGHVGLPLGIALTEARARVTTALKPGGRVLILGPNFRHCTRDYYDDFDHHLPLQGFDVELVQPRTLPYTFRSWLPSRPWLVRLYVRLPRLWRFFGARFFHVGRKPA